MRFITVKTKNGKVRVNLEQKAYEALALALSGAGVNTGDRLKAAQYFLDQLIGKASQPVEHSGEVNVLAAIFDRESKRESDESGD